MTLIRGFETDNQRDQEIAVWELGAGETGETVEVPYFGANAVLQVSGTFGGAYARLDRSVDGAAWVPVCQLDGSPFSHRGSGLREVRATGLLIRPRVVGGNGGTLITFTLAMWR